MIDRQELLRAMSELSEAGYKTFDKDELLKKVGIDTDSVAYKSIWFIGEHFGGYLMDAAEDKLKRMVTTHFPNYIDRYERLENMLETNIKQPLKGVDFRKILNTADGLAAGFRTINIVTNSQIYQDNLAEIKKIKNLEPPYDGGDGPYPKG